MQRLLRIAGRKLIIGFRTTLGRRACIPYIGAMLDFLAWSWNVRSCSANAGPPFHRRFVPRLSGKSSRKLNS